jgi:hypothetical protein
MSQKFREYLDNCLKTFLDGGNPKDIPPPDEFDYVEWIKFDDYLTVTEVARDSQLFPIRFFVRLEKASIEATVAWRVRFGELLKSCETPKDFVKKFIEPSFYDLVESHLLYRCLWTGGFKAFECKWEKEQLREEISKWAAETPQHSILGLLTTLQNLLGVLGYPTHEVDTILDKDNKVIGVKF